ncbi:acetyltransferase [Shewanella sp. Scap07]|uniref:acetyltransferase n=1 Tax=Shewanella sp. Scap07 TaxID=2589987 RepID=UPI0015BDB2AA|nr:acetyltransferase [Shewanella sp. Scap07]QLE86064.1 acetyltransferase [Shewanella sp. Scap07]
MKPKVYIIGSGGHAKVVIDAIESTEQYLIAGLIDDFKSQHDMSLNYPIVGKVNDIPSLVIQQQPLNLFLAIGDNYSRYNILEKLKKFSININFISIVHRNATVSKHAHIASGSIIMANACIGPSAVIKEHVVVNHGSSIDHDCIIDNFASTSPGATLCGSVRVKQFSVVGAGAVIIEKVTIGENCLIGAGSTVISNIESNQLAVGTPAKAISKRVLGSKYLK